MGGPAVISGADQYYLADPSFDRSKQLVVDEPGPGGHAGRAGQAYTEQRNRQVLVEARSAGRVPVGRPLVMRPGSLRRYSSRRP